MKKILTIFATASIFVACNSKTDLDTNKDVVVTDTTNMYKSNASTDVNTANQLQPQEQAPAAPTKIIRETRVVYVDRTPRATHQQVHQAAPVEPVTVTPQPQPQSTNTSTTASTGNGNADKSGVGNNGTIGDGNQTSSTIPQEKKGWSNSAKDAVIGGVGGAVVGAVISKKKGTGAVIGGILGAAGGYILGKKKDKNANQVTDANYTSY